MILSGRDGMNRSNGRLIAWTPIWQLDIAPVEKSSNPIDSWAAVDEGVIVVSSGAKCAESLKPCSLVYLRGRSNHSVEVEKNCTDGRPEVGCRVRRLFH